MIKIAITYFNQSGDFRFLIAVTPVVFSAFFHPLIGRLFKARNRYLVLYVHIFFYLSFNVWNQVAIAKFYTNIISNDQFVMIELLTILLASLIACTPYIIRTLILNGLLIGTYALVMIYCSKIRDIDIVRHTIQGLGLGATLSLVMMTIYRYRVYFLKQEEILKERAKKIEMINEEILTMIQATPASVIKIDQNLDITFASKTEEIINFKDSEKINFRDVIAKIEVNEDVSIDLKDQFLQALSVSIGENYQLGYQCNSHKFLSEFKLAGKYVSAKYGPHIDSNGDIDYMMIIISDNSLKIANKKHTFENEMILSIADNPARFEKFLREISIFLEKLKQALNTQDYQENITKILQELHSFKGIARLVNLKILATTIHETESLFSDSRIPSHQALLMKVNKIEKIKEKMTEIASSKFGISLDSNMSMAFFKDSDIMSAYRQGSLETFVMSRSFGNLSQILRDFSPMLEQQAIEQSKPKPILNISGPEIFVYKKYATKITSIMMHILSNSVDHSFEKGVSQQANIFIEVSLTEEGFQVCIFDDGIGLALRAIHDRAISLGIITHEDKPNNLETAKLIFIPSFSTKNEISQSSGRGVGMSAVRDEVLSLGGKVDLCLATDETMAENVAWKIILTFSRETMI